MGSGPGGPPTSLTLLSEGPWSTLVWGASRAVTLRVLYALARANDPHLLWHEIRRPGVEAPDPGPAQLGWVPRDRMFFLEPAAVRPSPAPSEEALRAMLRPGDGTKELEQFRAFLRLPQVAQDVVAVLGSSGRRRVAVVADAEPLRPYFPGGPEELRPLLRTMAALDVLPFIGEIAPVTRLRLACDFVFEVRLPDPTRVRDGALVCEQAPAEAILPLGVPIPFRQLAEVDAALVR